MVGGLGALAWSLAVWQWRDPFTSLYTALEQRRLAEAYDALARGARPAVADRAALARLAGRHRLSAHRGDPIGRIEIPRIGLDMVVVNGTDPGTLKKGPGRDFRTFMPGEGELVYVAGHRTTYLAPFADIDRIRQGDRIHVEVPYGIFTYEVTRHRIVDGGDLSVLESAGRELLRLQACHPRFFATRRYVVFARGVSVETAGGRLDLSAPARA
jgi:sortase A